MPTPDERPDEVDDILFDQGAVDELVHAGAPGSLEFPRLPDGPSSRQVDDSADDIFGDDPVVADAAAGKPESWRIALLPPSGPGHPVAVDTVDAALFGRAEPSAPTADVQPDLTPPDIAPFEAPFEEDDATVEGEVVTAPALAPLIVDDEDPAFGAHELVDEGGAPESDGDRRGRRLVFVAAAFGLVVIAAATLGVMAFTGSDDPRPAVNTDREVTTTTASTTTSPPPPTPAPDTAPPAANPPVTSAPRPRTPTTTARPAPPAPAATQPAPPPPPPDPPPTDPPSTTILPPTTF
jgi:hypothetical protein